MDYRPELIGLSQLIAKLMEAKANLEEALEKPIDSKTNPSFPSIAFKNFIIAEREVELSLIHCHELSMINKTLNQ